MSCVRRREAVDTETPQGALEFVMGGCRVVGCRRSSPDQFAAPRRSTRPGDHSVDRRGGGAGGCCGGPAGSCCAEAGPGACGRAAWSGGRPGDVPFSGRLDGGYVRRVGRVADGCRAAGLSPDRQLPHPLPKSVQRLRRIALAPAPLRHLDAERLPEWPDTAIPSPAERPPPGERLRCHVLIPAHDEEAVIRATLTSLAQQSRVPDEVVVIADNCTDGTVEVARGWGVQVVETIGNTEKKAGALNQQLARMLPSAAPREVFMVMDADSTLDPRFLEVAMGLLESDPDLMAVGGLFYGESGGGLVGQCQRNEFSRYQRVVARRLNRVFVLTGTASVMRGYALRAVAEARGPLIPGPPGQGVRHVALTEDNELTLALRSLGATMTSPPQCRVDDRDHDHVASPVAATAALAPRSTGERRRLRTDQDHGDVLGPAAGTVLRRGRLVVLPAPPRRLAAGRGPLCSGRRSG